MRSSLATSLIKEGPKRVAVKERRQREGNAGGGAGEVVAVRIAQKLLQSHIRPGGGAVSLAGLPFFLAES